LCSLSRARELTPIRLDFISQAIDLRIATLADLARFLHRDPSALSQLLRGQAVPGLSYWTFAKFRSGLRKLGGPRCAVASNSYVTYVKPGTYVPHNKELDPRQRLQLHQAESQPRMEALQLWMQAQFTERIIEPNSSLGAAILYMQKRWSQLTLFLRIEGAPLDSNIVERALKKAILHRKSALFYKTLNGARVGDVFMSLIYTAELNGVAPFEYLVALQRHADEVAASPGDWMPWNYQATCARHSAGPAAPE
jgi:hypothetical protein